MKILEWNILTAASVPLCCRDIMVTTEFPSLFYKDHTTSLTVAGKTMLMAAFATGGNYWELLPSLSSLISFEHCSCVSPHRAVFLKVWWKCECVSVCE